MTLYWAHRYQGIGAAFGYATFGRNLYAALEKDGMIESVDASIAIHMVPPYMFNLVRFKHNVLFTMFEFDRVPKQWHTQLDKADLVVVPCRHNKKIFEEATDTKVEICQGGVNAGLFPYLKRTKGDMFTFLFVGDNNTRKGTHKVAQAWEAWNERYPAMAEKTQLIMKLTAYGQEQELTQKSKNAYVDYRVLPLVESEDNTMPTLPALYEYANCFLWPTMGEGWGLPLCEAMSSGLPCIYTPYGGTEDTAHEEYAYPVTFGKKEIELKNLSGATLEPVYAPDPDVDSVVERMHEIYIHYDEALEKGYKAAGAMRLYFGWDKSATRLKEIIENTFQAVA